MSMDPYTVLGVNKSSTDSQIKNAYKNLAKQHHPDRGGNEAKFKEISSAYEQIKTAEKRQQYDMSQQFGQGNHAFNFNGNAFDMAEMFESFFGGGPRQRWQQRRPRNKNLQISIECTLEEVYKGISKQVKIKETGKTMSIDIPAGIDNGQSIKYPKLGMDQIREAPPGDLLVRVYVKPHARYKRKRLDIHVEETVNCFDAMLGKTIDVATIDGKTIKLKVHPGTQPGTIMRIPEHGMKNVHKQAGHLYIHILVSIPNNLTQKDKDDIRNIGITYS